MAEASAWADPRRGRRGPLVHGVTAHHFAHATFGAIVAYALNKAGIHSDHPPLAVAAGPAGTDSRLLCGRCAGGWRCCR